MKQPMLTKALLATSLTLVFAMTTLAPNARAEMVSEQVAADAITPEQTTQTETVVVKKQQVQTTLPKNTISTPVIASPAALQAAPVVAPAPQAQVVQAAPSAPVIVNTNTNTNTNSSASASQAAVASKPTMGQALDQGVNNKMDEVRNQFETALLHTLDRIKINVDDGSTPPAAAASASAVAVAGPSAAAASAASSAVAAPVAAPPVVVQPVAATAVVNSGVINNASGSQANYMTVERAPGHDDEDDSGETVADAKDKPEEMTGSRFHVSPLIGVASMSNSGYYDIGSGLSTGIELEGDISEHFSAWLGYNYSKFDIGLGSSAPLYSYYGGNNFGQLQYHQNVFELGGRFYLMPRDSAVRLYLGAGVGYDKGYINYGTNSNFSYGSSYGYGGTSDYELTNWLGILQVGGDVKIAKNISFGASFKYYTIINSSQNEYLNNYGFYSGGYAGAITQDQAIAGGTLQNQSFYTILANLKIGF